MAIAKLIVAESNIGPGIGAVVTTGTLAIVVIWRCVIGVARLAIIWETIVFDISPIVGIVTIGALTTCISVPGRTLMARLAIGIGIVIKSDIGPVVGDVAIGTLSRPVATRCLVAR